MIDVIVSVGCLYLFTKVIEDYALTDDLREMAKRNRRGSIVAIASSFISFMVIGISSYLTSPENLEFFLLVFPIDTMTNSSAVFWINYPIMKVRMHPESRPAGAGVIVVKPTVG